MKEEINSSNLSPIIKELMNVFGAEIVNLTLEAVSKREKKKRKTRNCLDSY